MYIDHIYAYDTFIDCIYSENHIQNPEHIEMFNIAAKCLFQNLGT